MPTTPHISNIPDAQRRIWLKELRQLMEADASFAGHCELVNNAHLFSRGYPVRPNQNRSINEWSDEGSHLAVFRTEDTGKFSIVAFQVIDWRRNQNVSFCDEVVIEIDLFAYVTRVNEEPYVIHVIDPKNDTPVRYQHIFTFRGTHVFDATDIQVSDLLERFPGQIENILDQIAFIADVILTGLDSEQVKPGTNKM